MATKTCSVIAAPHPTSSGFAPIAGWPGRRIARGVSHVDLAPTFLDLAGIAEDPGARGESLVPELFGGEVPPRAVLIDQPRNPFYPPKRAYIEGSYKLHHAIDSNTYRLSSTSIEIPKRQAT